MPSHRSRSPSTLSEGEIVESGSDMKATTSHAPFNGINVDRQTRVSSSFVPSPASRSSRSPPTTISPSRRRQRSRSRSRSPSPYHHSDRYYDRRRWQQNNHYQDDDNGRQHAAYPSTPRRFSGHGYDERRHHQRHRTSYYDYDREEDRRRGYDTGPMRYSDDYERRHKRRRTGSRSPLYREVRKPKHYSSEELETKRNEGPSKSVTGQEDSSAEQQDSMRDAEMRKNQVSQDVSPAVGAGSVDEYVFPFSFFFFFFFFF